MRKKLLIFAVALVAMFSYTLTVSATPKTMKDGTVFDAEYYAQNNPDVVQALGTSETALYQHYVTYGKSEGRKPYADAKVTTTYAETKTLFGETYYHSQTTNNGIYIYDTKPDGKWKDYILTAIDASGVTNDTSDYDKCVAFNNYICSVVEYGTMPIGTDISQSEFTDYCLVSGLAACQGYADAFQSMCCASGIECYIVSGIVDNSANHNASHVWNMVKINGVDYYVDVTGNDTCANIYLMNAELPSDHTIWEMRY